MPSSRGSFWPRNWNRISCIGWWILYHWATWRTGWRFLKKLKIELPYDPAIPFLGIYAEKSIIQKYSFIPVFMPILFTIAKTWKQPKCSSTDEWMKKMWYIYTQWNITKPWKRVASYGSISSISRNHWGPWIPWRFFSPASYSCFFEKDWTFGMRRIHRGRKGWKYDLVEPRTEFESWLTHLLILRSYLC